LAYQNKLIFLPTDFCSKELNQLQIVDPGLDSSVTSMCSPGNDVNEERPKECSTPVLQRSNWSDNPLSVGDESVANVNLSHRESSGRTENVSETRYKLRLK